MALVSNHKDTKETRVNTYCPPRPPRPPRPAGLALGGSMPFARRYTTTMPYDSRPCESNAEATPPRAVSPSPCLTICIALWSVSDEIASSQNANAAARALTKSAFVVFFSLLWAGLGFGTPLIVAQLRNWLSVWWPIHWPKVRRLGSEAGLNV